MDKQNTNLKRKVIFSVMGILIALAIMVGYVQRYIEFDKLHKQQIADVQKAEWLLTQETQDQALLFSALIDTVSSNPAVQKAFMNNDRQSLMWLAGPIFSELKNRYDVTHMYFHQLDRKCFLRAHNPARYGDAIIRKTLMNASEQGGPSFGFEVGPFGTFALRYVQPWRVDGKLIGFIELGKDIEQITRDLKNVLGCEFVITIDKSFVEREKWEEGLEMLGRSGDWDQLDNVVITGNTFEVFPQEVSHHLQLDLSKKTCNRTPSIKVGDIEYYAGCFGLYDVSGNHVGRMLIIQDVSDQASVIVASSVFFGVIILIAGSLASVFFYFYIGRIDSQLKSVDRKQREEIVNRRFAEAQLNEARQRAETAFSELREIQQKLQLHIENTPLGVIQWSPELIVESWNSAAETIFGYSAQEAIGRSAYDLIIPEETRKIASEICHKLIVTTESSVNRAINNDREDHRIICQWHNTPLIDKDGKTIGISSIVQDITKTLEYEQRLQNEKERAEAASRSKSMFMANISHELRTPMNAIIGFSDLLQNEDLNEEQIDYAQTIYRSGQHLLSLINDVLDISKIEAGKLEIIKEPCQIKPILQQIQSMMQPVANEHQLNFEVVIRDSLPEEIVTDGKRLYQCLVNLVGNAIKFTEQGSVTLRAGLLDSDANPWMFFEVKDTGIGIPPERMEKVFETFEQGDVDISIKYGGTGLGLSITRQLIERMGGALTVGSQVGVGSTFTITLPLISLTESTAQNVP